VRRVLKKVAGTKGAQLKEVGREHGACVGALRPSSARQRSRSETGRRSAPCSGGPGACPGRTARCCPSRPPRWPCSAGQPGRDRRCLGRELRGFGGEPVRPTPAEQWTRMGPPRPMRKRASAAITRLCKCAGESGTPAHQQEEIECGEGRR
jgi:hypothetical protein